jgi:hypothetical protein
VAYPQQIRTVPKTCKDLLPDMFEYIYFFEQVGDLGVVKDANSAKKVYDVLAIRKIYQETSQNYINPIDEKIKNTICDCYTKNNSQLFTADSKTIRDCLDKTLPKLIKDSKAEFVVMQNKMKKDENLVKLTNQQRDKIEKLKYNALVQMEKELTRGKEKTKDTTID